MRLWPIYLTAFAGLLAFYMIPVQIPFYLNEYFGSDGTTVGLTIALVTLTSSMSSLFYGRVRKKLTIPRIYMVLLLIYGSGFFGMGMAHTLSVLQLFAALSGLGLGMFMVNTNAWLMSRVPPARRGRAAGMLTMGMFLGMFCSPIAVHPIVVTVGAGHSFSVVGGLMLLTSAAIAVSLWAKRAK